MTAPSPVGVSGPGALSQRTDKQPLRDVTGLPYGDNQALMQQQAGAPMAQSSPPPTPPPPPLSAPTQRPNEPVTHGAAAGPGAGPEAIQPGNPAQFGMPGGGGPISQAIARAAAVDTSGLLAELLNQAQSRGL